MLVLLIALRIELPASPQGSGSSNEQLRRGLRAGMEWLEESAACARALCPERKSGSFGTRQSDGCAHPATHPIYLPEALIRSSRTAGVQSCFQ